MTSKAKWVAWSLAVVAFTSASVLAVHRLWPRWLALSPIPEPPAWELERSRPVVRPGGDALLAEVATFDDELLAYLHFEYLRVVRAVKPHEVLLTCREVDGRPVYRIFLSPDHNDLLTAVPALAELAAEGFISGFRLEAFPRKSLENKQQQTKVFLAAYSMPVRRKLESLRDTQLIELMQRFLVFKSRTDPRVRRRVGPVPVVLSRDEARQFAADIITVADFYWLPLDFFLGIGAMENNYMNVTGDLDHAVWKRRAQKGDIVLRRRRGRVLVLNYATGPWQITRETLRYAHKLYLKDERDYSLLPERLRPPRELNLDEISTGVLTTYAGLLFRHLLDRFDGDVSRAIGAYNGGIRNPNMGYEEGVRLAADYARRVFEQAAALSDRAVAETRFFAPARRSD